MIKKKKTEKKTEKQTMNMKSFMIRAMLSFSCFDQPSIFGCFFVNIT